VRVLAIDQGTSATKALVVDEVGRVEALAEVPANVRHGADGAVEVDPEELWASVLAAGTSALASAGHGEIDAVGLANQGETVLAWDRSSGAPRSAGIVWQDRRAGAVCERLQQAGMAERLTAITGLELDPYFVAPKLVWLREQLDGASRDGDLAITTTDTWLLHRLCSEGFVTDAATASRSLLLDLDRVEWSAEAVELFGLAVGELPTIVDNASILGGTDCFGGSVPVAGACVDQQAALFAESCWSAGEAKCTYGTGAFLLATTGIDPVRSSHGLVGCVAWRLAGRPTWCLDGQVFTVGAAMSWLERVGVIDGPADLDRLGGSVPDAAGVAFVPGLAGLGAPFWAPQARGALTGLSLGTERAHLVRAAIEGIAAQVAWLARAAGEDLGRPLERLRVDGGLTRSRTLLQVQADLLQATVEVYPSPHATALGVAAFARLGLSGRSSVSGSYELTSAVPDWQAAAVVEPRIGADEAEQRLQTWRVAAEATLPL
jgi:glycerol kinase